MSEETVQEVVEQTATLAEFSMDKMQSFFDAAEKVLEQYGAEAVDLGLSVLRIDALSQMSFSLSVLFVMCAMYPFYVPWYRKWMQDSHNACYTYINTLPEGEERTRLESIKDTWDLELRKFVGVASMLAYCFLGFLAGLQMINVWAWVGIFYPELYAVHKFLL